MQGGAWGSSSPALPTLGTKGSGEHPPQDQGGSQQGRRPRQGADPQNQGRGPPWARTWDKAPDLTQRAWSPPGDSCVSLLGRQVSQREMEEVCRASPHRPAQAPGAARRSPSSQWLLIPHQKGRLPPRRPCPPRDPRVPPPRRGPRRRTCVQRHRLLSFLSQGTCELRGQSRQLTRDLCGLGELPKCLLGASVSPPVDREQPHSSYQATEVKTCVPTWHPGFWDRRQESKMPGLALALAPRRLGGSWPVLPRASVSPSVKREACANFPFCFCDFVIL